jgi:oligopeptide transport system ATP-binding protein
MTESALLRVDHLTKHFPVTRGLLGRTVGAVRAVDDVSFAIGSSETLGLVGESGSGKTTVGRSILRLIEPTSGSVVFDGTDVLAAEPAELRRLRRSMQVIFQDPYSSLNPRLRVVDLVGEALEVHGLTRGAETEKRVSELLRRVGLSPSSLNRYPHEFSGGQRQRIGVARAIALEPKLIICDEPVSALDVSIQAQVVNLLQDLGRELGLSYLFIAHDLSVVRHLSHRVAVMYLGELVELAPVKRLFAAPAHPYTRALLSAIPVPDPKRERRHLALAGDIPSPLNPPSGCRFHTRCPAVMERCKHESPPGFEPEPGHSVRCFHAEGVSGEGWYAEVETRIEARVAENERVAPPPSPVTLTAELPGRAPSAAEP